MDPRLERILAEQRRHGFKGFAGSEFGGTIRIADQLLNEIIAAGIPASGPVQAVHVHSREGNWLDVTLTLSKPRFMPPLRFELAIDRQPELPHNPVLVLRMAGGAGAVLKLASSALSHAMALPPGVHLDSDRVHVNLRTMLQHRGHASWLDYAQQICVGTEEAGLAVIVLGRL